MSESSPFEITRAVLPIGAAVAAVVVIISLIGGGIVYVTGIASTSTQNSKEIEVLTSRINTIDVSQQALSTKQSVQDVKLDTILDRIQEIKTALEKTQP
ncbi:MAG TPA: hypothetical protein PLI01_00320 [Nitrospira sp.]|nr:hypothetical protein [Nitrospira sp.]HNA25203.1 hypothetical protein [Nitrospira sp.]HNI17493.1 hypothetical protein [Nitrospira sp.]